MARDGGRKGPSPHEEVNFKMVSAYSARGLDRDQTAQIFLISLFLLSRAYASLLIEPTFIGQKLRTFAKEALGVDEMQDFWYQSP